MTMQKPKPKSKPPAHRRTRVAPKATPKDPNLWRDLAAIGRRIPKSARAELPRDLAKNFDHYLDGTDKQD